MEEKKQNKNLWLIVGLLCLFSSGLFLGSALTKMEIKNMMDDNNFIFCNKEIKTWYDTVHNITTDNTYEYTKILIPVR